MRFSISNIRLLTNSCLVNNVNLFAEIKRQRKWIVCIYTIDGHNSDIPSHFAKKYKSLYDSVDDEDNLSDIEESIEGKITQSSYNGICQIT